MNVLVFCSAQDVPEKYTNASAQFATLLAQNGHTLVWGASNRGVMKVIADSAQSAGGKLIGISMPYFAHKAHPGADEVVVAKDLSDRKKLMLERADAVVALPGGIGTLDEVTEVLALKRHGDHTKPVLFLNTDGFYNGMKEQFARMNADGFLANNDKDLAEGQLCVFLDTPQEAIEYINQSETSHS